MPTPEHTAARVGKVTRLRTGAAPRVLELCSGCGGLSLGLKTAGFELTAHIETDVVAAESYALNFASKDSGKAWERARDMVKCSPAELVEELELTGPTDAAFDILAAGLPCQAFARIGRSKLRQITGDDDAYRNDPRAALYRRFLEYISETQPLAIIIENVPDILNFGGHNVPEEICATLASMGYRAAYTILNAAYHGVPQIRERLFLVAIADTMGVDPVFPEATHHLALPRGYESSRSVALKHVSDESPYFRPVHRPPPELTAAITVEEALGDLPAINEHLKTPAEIRRRRLTDSLPYRKGAAPSTYGKAMRAWNGFATDGSCDAHLVRLTPRDFPIFRNMNHGADYPQARALAEKMLAEEMNRRGIDEGNIGSPGHLELRDSIVPPYDPAKFPNKWWKMEAGKPSRTLTAHIGKDTYSHIHYDSVQSRTISVREAARLQSFPDGFRFAGRMNAAFRQIGNAVPPLLGLAVAAAVKMQVDKAVAALPECVSTMDGQVAA
ncbi:MAG: DNA cytosine methyltransferase [Mesorhizobium sp.]|uniref:DNA cytosine methyltransferase n=1 Tax=Mesorhizobium sp. TaxID=1871066 RepID=UPI00122AE9C0|nr:DNA cytosine methyltransferase [Mesorhizobium sp.]TIP24265.1 MAG: DNA cytosine methyltransferase [Mesorhizobium sp.]